MQYSWTCHLKSTLLPPFIACVCARVSALIRCACVHSTAHCMRVCMHACTTFLWHHTQSCAERPTRQQRCASHWQTTSHGTLTCLNVRRNTCMHALSAWLCLPPCPGLKSGGGGCGAGVGGEMKLCTSFTHSSSFYPLGALSHFLFTLS